jgi:hypothetical protein
MLAALKCGDARRTDTHGWQFTFRSGNILNTHIYNLAMAFGKFAKHPCRFGFTLNLSNNCCVPLERKLIRLRRASSGTV